ncbi:MAG TPA: FHA domain-containing protein, partial [Asanoa sp.]|nr:FHA domain-containing protein [Asanoa sp.]
SQSRALGLGDVVELYPGVQVARSRTWTSGGVTNPVSVMAEAPTMSMRALDR